MLDYRVCGTKTDYLFDSQSTIVVPDNIDIFFVQVNPF